MINFKICDAYNIAKVYSLRKEVFVDEQLVPIDEEIDEFDKVATHFIAKDGDVAVACGRVIITKNEAHIGRLAVKKHYRGRGIGKLICEYMINYCKECDCTRVWLNSQIQAIQFYQKVGFKAIGDAFIDAGIEHKQMLLTL